MTQRIQRNSLLERPLVVGSDGKAHLPRESAGDCHLVICGKFVRGEVGSGRGQERCRECVSRASTVAVPAECEDEVPEAVRMGRGLGARRAHRLADRQGNH